MSYFLPRKKQGTENPETDKGGPDFRIQGRINGFTEVVDMIITWAEKLTVSEGDPEDPERMQGFQSQHLRLQGGQKWLPSGDFHDVLWGQ